MKTVIFYTFDDEYEMGNETASPTLAEARELGRNRARENSTTVAVWKHKAAGSDMRRLACSLFNRVGFQLDAKQVGRWVVEQEFDEDEGTYTSTDPRWEAGDNGQ